VAPYKREMEVLVTANSLFKGRKKTLKPWMRIPAPTGMLRDPRKTIHQP
jgi:hypothetical protein